MKTFADFIQYDSLMPLMEEVANIIAAQEKEPMEFLLDCAKQYPELEVLILDKLNERDQALEEAGLLGGVGGAIGNFFRGGMNRLQQGFQTGSQNAKFNAAIKAVRDLAGLIGNGNMQRIVNYIQQKAAGTWPQKQMQPQAPQAAQPQAAQPQVAQPQVAQPGYDPNKQWTKPAPQGSWWGPNYGR
jgi:hypothetical protein